LPRAPGGFVLVSPRAMAGQDYRNPFECRQGRNGLFTGPGGQSSARALAGGKPMRDWFLPLLPVLVVGYFLVFPDQFYALIDWAIHVIR
jgi:hypothetical protein